MLTSRREYLQGGTAETPNILSPQPSFTQRLGLLLVILARVSDYTGGSQITRSFYKCQLAAGAFVLHTPVGGGAELASFLDSGAQNKRRRRKEPVEPRCAPFLSL